MAKKVLYIGGFELPDKNAAAQRVVALAKALRLIGYSINFFGVTRERNTEGEVEGFNYKAMPYPDTPLKWVKYVLGFNIINVIKQEAPDIVITYNYPAIAQIRLTKYCKHNGILVIGDITEWYSASNPIKAIDVILRMRYSNKRLDGVIAISRYLYNYYSKSVPCVLIPPLTDASSNIWRNGCKRKDKTVVDIVYVGSPGKKDRLDYLVKGTMALADSRIHLNIVGISSSEYCDIYKDKLLNSDNNLNIIFWGRKSHQEAVEILKKSDFQIFFRDRVRSNHAGFPTKFVESFTAGIPVITNRFSNVSDYLKDGINGFLIDEPNEDSINSVLHRVACLSELQLSSLSSNIDKDTFDYHNYSQLLSHFIDTMNCKI